MLDKQETLSENGTGTCILRIKHDRLGDNSFFIMDQQIPKSSWLANGWNALPSWDLKAPSEDEVAGGRHGWLTADQ
jgi:hypothetical protein